MSAEHSISGWMLRLFELRPISRLWVRNGTTIGSPGEGHSSSLACSAYQSGSTQTSATQSTPTPGAVDGDGGSGAEGCTGVADGAGGPPRSRGFDVASRGMVPVVKS